MRVCVRSLLLEGAEQLTRCEESLSKNQENIETCEVSPAHGAIFPVRKFADCRSSTCQSKLRTPGPRKDRSTW